ncbi:MAG TPA: cbb3-type cytochrome c oxidase N-terminal domain-containing protein [Flavobacteriales bacterium]|nr:cbb3-type cytochrome c oxidase N-terminal domain-containing protein [Flavobacteriales bacterium]
MRLRNFLPLALLIIGSFWSAPLLAQDAAAAATSSPGLLENPGMETNYILLAMAVLQVVIILTLSGIMKTLGGTGTVWADFLKGRRAAGVLALLLAGSTLDAQAATPAVAMVTTQTLLYWLISANIILFVIIVAQLTVIRGMVRVLGGPEAETKAAEETSFADTVLNRLTRTVKVEKEEDILMHHEYDGIRELDNVLPPWWLWLFYGTIIWSVVYIFNVHISGTWLHQADEYEQEMAEAKAEVEAYLAKSAAAVDENTVVAMTDASALAAGKNTFQTYCKACHGENGEGNAVGPNLTDAYWLHGGSIKHVFSTIKYGVQEKGMQSWKKDLKPVEIQQVASYIMSLQGTNPANAKAPQGDLWKEEGAAPADSTAATPDTTAVAVAQ